MNIMLVGCNGKMGHTIIKLCAEKEYTSIVCGLDISKNIENPFPVFTDATNIPDTFPIDVVIDFSHPLGVEQTVSFCKTHKKPLVYATTGLDQSGVDSLKELSNSVAVFMSANMSLGVNLLIKLCKEAAVFLRDDFDIEIIEKHHNQKIDAPSGTALKIAEEINKSLDNSMEYIYDRHDRRQKRAKNEIGIHAIRGGTIVGQHDVIFAGRDETITISHDATSKEVFAQGALRAASYIQDKPAGMYGMNDMI